MAPTPKGNEKRRHPRLARRIPCELYISGARHPGIVKDVSRGGLFVQTRTHVPLGTALTLVFPPGDGRTEIRVVGHAVRTEQVGAQLETHGAGGIGVEITEPGALGRFLGDLRLTLPVQPTATRKPSAPAASPISATARPVNLEWLLNKNEVYHRPCMGWSDLAATKCGRCGTEIPAAIVQEAGEDRDPGRALRELRERTKALSQRLQAMQAKAELPPARSQPKPDPNG